MTLLNRKGCILFVVVFIGFIELSCFEKPSIKVGVGEAVITPPTGLPMAGYSSRKATGTHDDLIARSLVIEDANENSVALITLALLNLSEALMDSIRLEIHRQTGLPINGIVISCTHTHSGPSPWGMGEENQKKLVDNTVASAVNAWNGRIPGSIGSGSAVNIDLGKNDRKMEYGGLHPDPEVGILKVEDEKGRLIGIIFNYGYYPLTLDLHNTEYTEDWPYYSITGIKEKVGDDVWVAYFQSAQGNVKVGYIAEL